MGSVGSGWWLPILPILPTLPILPHRLEEGQRRASRRSIEDSVRNAIRLAERLGLRSLAFPIIGAGAGGFDTTEAERIMLETFAALDSGVQVVLVRYRVGG